MKFILNCGIFFLVGGHTVYVCVCNAYRESSVLDAIKKTAANNAATVEQIYARLGSRPRCGRCLTHVKNLIDVNQQKAAGAPVAVRS